MHVIKQPGSAAIGKQRVSLDDGTHEVGRVHGSLRPAVDVEVVSVSAVLGVIESRPGPLDPGGPIAASQLPFKFRPGRILDEESKGFVWILKIYLCVQITIQRVFIRAIAAVVS